MEGEQQEGAGPETTGINEQSEEHEALRAETPRIYVASLSDYNAGILHGEWLDASQAIDELQTAVTAMLARSPSDPSAEEFAVHDYEGFGDFLVGEYDSLDWISAVARGISEHGLAFAAWAEQCDDNEEQLAKFDEAYLGSYDSLADYAEQMLDGFALERAINQHVPASLQSYVTIDAEAFGNDLVLGGDIAVARHKDGVWVFEGMI